MEAQATIHYQLDLALRLIDTVTGRVITEKNVQFLGLSSEKKAIPRGGGLYLFLNTGREDFDFEIHVYGYEPQQIRITYPRKEEWLPIREVYLLPLDNPILERTLTLRGMLSGIEEIEAVSLTDVSCCIKEFDARKRIMTILNQRNQRFHHIHYGLVNRERTAYEHFELEKELSLQSLKCKRTLEKPSFINQPITRVIFGQVNAQGEYLLKVMKEEQAQYLVRFVVNGEVFYQMVDFHEEECYLDRQKAIKEASEEKEA